MDYGLFITLCIVFIIGISSWMQSHIEYWIIPSIEYTVTRADGRSGLYDVIHENTPSWMSSYGFIADILTWGMVPFVIYAYFQYPMYTQKILLIWMCLIVLKFICGNLTIIPSCVIKETRTMKDPCFHDMMFSGHTVSMIVMSFILYKSFPLIGWISFLFPLFGIPFLVISREHYTIDVFVAIIIVVCALGTFAPKTIEEVKSFL